MRELESSLQEFGEFLLKAQLVRPTAAPYFVRWVRRFLSRPASDEPLTDQVRGFCEELERSGGSEDWQVRQADQALRIYFVNFLDRTDWHRRPVSTVVDEHGRTSPVAALEQLRVRVRTRHYSYRTECTYADWVRRFLHYAAAQQGGPHPRVESEVVRDYLTHLAVRDRVSASTQNQAFCAILFLCREVLGVNVESVSPGVRAKRGERLPVVLSMPETAALLSAMSGTPRLMAALIYGGGLRVSECCELRIKDLDFDQGLVVVRRGKGDKDRSTLASHTRFGGSEGGQGGSAGSAHPQTGFRTYPAPLFCHASAAERVDIRQIQEYLGHANVETTMVYTHVVKEFRNPARSPLDIIHKGTGQ